MSHSGPSETLDVTLRENRIFQPPRGFVEKSVYSPADIKRLRELGARDIEGYWAEAARDLHWFEKWNRILEWNPPFAQWFVGGRINASYNCLDRHLSTRPNQAALIWEGEPGECSTWTYAELHRQVETLTAGLRGLGLKPGERVAIYMPMVPEAVVAMLACARGGFTHTVVFGGFSSEALKDRIQDSQARAVITADFGWRKGAKVQLLEQVIAAATQCPSLEHAVVLQREHAGQHTPVVKRSFQARREFSNHAAFPGSNVARIDWHELMASLDPRDVSRLGRAEELDAEHPLFILYTSGTTGKPKGIVHSTGGYLVGALRSTKLVFDIKPQDVYWCTADIGWVTGHSYVVYGPLAAGATAFLYEGAPTTPENDRFWAMIERHRISILYTAPTAIRAFMRLGDQFPKGRDLSSLRLMGTVGEPINPAAWTWYHEQIGNSRCPIVDTFWQTETGSIVISPIPADTATKPGSATRPLPGFEVDVVDKSGKSVPVGQGGYLVIRKPWPSMARTIQGDPERFKKTYFSDFADGVYFTGDGARRDEDGYIWCLGRVDDVLNVAGHRLGTMEVESALVSHPKVAEAAVVGRPDDLKGQGLVAFVTLRKEFSGPGAGLQSIQDELRAHVVKEIGAIARPDEIRLTDGLPKTRSGKIMRRLLRELATSGSVQGDITTLEDLNVIAALQQGADEE
jgi:acetyl-CoA synthetase